MRHGTKTSSTGSSISRRSAIRTGGLAALAAGLLGTTAAPTLAKSADQPTGVQVCGYDLAGITREYQQNYREVDAVAYVAVDEFRESLTEEQSEQLERLIEILNDASAAYAAMQVSELARHLPGVAPIVPMLWEHIVEQPVADVGVCCGGHEA